MRPDDGVPPEEPPEPPPPKSARWVILVLAVALAAVVVVAALAFLPHFLTSSQPSGSHPTPSVIHDLCQPQSGLECKGSQIQLPRIVGASSENVSACYAVYPSGSSNQLVLNYSSSSNVFGVVIPQSLYNGASTSYYTNPAGFYNNTTASGEAAWQSHLASGSQSVAVTLPTSTTAWCLAWWDPGMPTTITLAQNVTLLSSS